MYGILLYQDVGTLAAGDLKGVARFLSGRIFSGDQNSERFGRDLSLLLQKEVFYGLKRGVYGTVRKRELSFEEVYGIKLNDSVRRGIEEVRKVDPSIPEWSQIQKIFQTRSTYHQVAYIHGDLNPENVLVGDDERGLRAKIIDFGEMMPKKKVGFTPLFWDFSRLLGEMILNYFEEMVTDEWSMGSESYLPFQKAFCELETVLLRAFLNEGKVSDSEDPRIGVIAKIYLSTLFDFINEAKSAFMPPVSAEVFKDYFYCQILFLLFYAKFSGEIVYKRAFGVKLALFFKNYVDSKDFIHTRLLQSLETFYFQYLKDLRGKTRTKEMRTDRSPFMGLSYFTEKDREFFFGRESFIQNLLQGIETYPFVSLSGASGSGKSSVVHAGVLPILREKGWKVFTFRPGNSPYLSATKSLKGSEDLIDSLRSLLEKESSKILLMGDQFEEIFTLCERKEDREDLGNSILEICKEFPDRFRFLLTIRADFWSRLLEEPSFGRILGDSGEYKNLGLPLTLTSMNPEELRRTIEKPLEVVGMEIQEGLTDLILSSVSREAGSLPLLEFCLEELYKRHTDGVLTYEAYKQIGEVKGALATYADRIYASLSDPEKEMLQKMMLQLVLPGMGTEDTRRIAPVEEITTAGISSTSNKNKSEFINRMADLRLVTTGTNEKGQKTVEVVHEALIREWKRLREWISVDRDFRVWQEKIRTQEKEWRESGKEDSLLLRGSNLSHSQEWLDKRRMELGSKEIVYITASKSRKQKRTVFLGILVGIVAMVILGIGTFGIIQYNLAEKKNLEALEANANAAENKLEAQKALDQLDVEKKKLDEAKREAEQLKIDAEEANRLAKEQEELAEQKKKEAEDARLKTEKLLEENNKKEAEILAKSKDILLMTEKIAKGFSMKKEELLRAGELNRWSSYKGSMDWDSAKKTCASLGKGWRLPKRGGWQVNYGANQKVLEKDWSKTDSDYAWFWTSEEYVIDRAYGFYVASGYLDYLVKDTALHVRCIR
ncbi:MAG: hypothetical protein H7A24_04005 [Leptospiraceae bacterium]|nr:hypothetical protein [Leptospiraceae bacterium]